MKEPLNCCFCVGKDWFRYRVGAIIIADGHVLLSYGEEVKHYYTVGGGVHVGETAEEALLREVKEETGEDFEIQRPLCFVENFFKGKGGSLEGLDCHTIEMYYLVKPKEKKEYDVGSVNSGGESEKMRWLPIDRLDEYDVRPSLIKDLVRNLPEQFLTIVNDGREQP